jgi:hypothetical protein
VARIDRISVGLNGNASVESAPSRMAGFIDTTGRSPTPVRQSTGFRFVALS